jgi:hypothetical protein
VIQITLEEAIIGLPKTLRDVKRRRIGFKHPAMPEQSQPRAESWRYQCDLNHIARFEPILSSQHQNVMHATLQGVNSED